MEVRSRGRKLSFELLSLSEDDDVMSTASTDSDLHNGATSPSFRKRNKKKIRKVKTLQNPENAITESSAINGGMDYTCALQNQSEITEISAINGSVNYSCTASTITETAVSSDLNNEDNCTVQTLTRPSGFGELRQRNVMNGGSVETVSDESVSSNRDENVKEEGPKIWRNSEQGMEPSGRKLEKNGTLDLKNLMDGDPNYTLPAEKSPLKYFMEEIYAGNSLRSTTTIGNDKERERVYDTIFRLPWRCELVINIGLFVCFDSFLSLLTIMPTRIIISIWKLLKRQFERPSSADLSDFGCFIVLIIGVTLLQQADISLIYHMIRGQGIIKLYVVYNVLEIFDRLCQNFGGDVMQALFNSADGLANCSPENRQFWVQRFIWDEVLAIISSVTHSFILLAQAITLSTCIVAHNNALFAMLVSNNFAEIKSNVFKRFSKDNVQSLVYFDSIERFHILAFILFVLAQNILEAEGPWFQSFLNNALVVYICEVMIDIIKHSFIAKFNDIKPTAFSEFLEDLCKQTLNMQPENSNKNLTFVPLAPACVVIRVLRPVYEAHLPYNPLPWRLFWILVLSAMSFVMLASLKMLVGMGLRRHAMWYVRRCESRKLHCD